MPEHQASNVEAQSRAYPSKLACPLRHRRQSPLLAFRALPQSRLNKLLNALGQVPSCRRLVAAGSKFKPACIS
eukprot:COSAG06_NODE_40604_length_400_cov_0.863787_1_plen_72_part_10